MLFGPLFRFELVRLARRGSHLPLRVALALLLLLGLLSSYFSLYPHTNLPTLLFGGADTADRTSLQKFGETFLLAFLVVQQAAVLLLTPVYAGGAVAEEKEHGRMDFLLTTTLSRWELVVGKLAARLVFVLAVIAVGLPVVLFTLLFGGVDAGRVLAGFAIAVISAIVVGAFAVMLSVLRHTLRDVLLWAFGTLTASGAGGLILGEFSIGRAGAVLSPVTVLWTLFHTWKQPIPPTGDPTWGIVGWYAAVFLPLAGVCGVIAVASVRTAVAPPPQPAPDNPVPDPPTEANPPPPTPPAEPALPDWYKLPERAVFGDHEVPAAAPDRGFLVPAVTDADDPLEWRERHFGIRLPLLESHWFVILRGCSVAAYLFTLGMLLFVGLVINFQSGEGPAQVVNAIARVVLVTAVLVTPFAGVRAAVSAAEERSKRTLESLLALPIDRSAILWAKVKAAAYRNRAVVLGVGVVTLAAFLAGGLNPFCIAGAATVLGGCTVCSLGLGVWLGMRCKTAVRAVLTHLVVMAGIQCGPVVAAPLVGPPVAALSPAWVVWYGTAFTVFDQNEDRHPESEVGAFCLAVPVGLGYAVIGLFGWRFAVRRIERE